MAQQGNDFENGADQGSQTALCLISLLVPRQGLPAI
jgi:hypothetical protein